MDGPSQDDLAAAAAVWADFPIAVQPRPLVLTGPVLSVTGFRVGHAKLNFIEGQVAVEPDVAEDAVKSFWAAFTRPPRLRRATGTHIRLYAADRAEHTFPTDRGPRLLPAWHLHFADSLGPIYVLDKNELDAAWAPPGTRKHSQLSGGSVTISADGLRGTCRFGTDPVRHHATQPARILERPAAVVIGPETVKVERPPSRDRGWLVDEGPRSRRAINPESYRSRVHYAVAYPEAFHLERPLGNRVLVNDRAMPISVTTASGESS